MKDTQEQIYDFFKESREEKITIPKKWLERNQYVIGDSIVLILVYIFLFNGLKMEWLLKDIIPIGGDTPYHFANYIDLKEILLPNWQISGWSDASFAGFQLFQSYPIFPFILIYLLDLFTGSGIAFKVIFIIGAIGLPYATYWTLLQSKIARPGPIFGAILSLAYLFHDDHFAFGGNLRSVFSGEFTHSLSILFLVIFCGLLYKAFENKKYTPCAIILLALIGFSHPVTFAVAFFLPLGFLFMRKGGTGEEKTFWRYLTFSKRSSIVVRIMLISGLLFSVWAIGYYMNSNYGREIDITNGLTVIQNGGKVIQNGGTAITKLIGKTHGWGIKFHYLIPTLLLPFAILFLLNVIYLIFYWKKSSEAQILFLWGILLSISFFLLKFMGFGVRFLPLLYLFVMLFLAATIGNIYKNTTKESVRILISCIIMASAIFIYYFAQSNNLFYRYQGTSGHNFIGAESRPDWKSVQQAAEFLSENYNTQKDNTKISNSPRIFSSFKGDLFRVTSGASMYDSLFSNSTFSKLGIWTGRKIDRQQITVNQFWNYMELSNTSIVIAPQKLTKYLNKTQYFKPLQTFDQFTIFETQHASRKYVIPLQNELIIRAPDMQTWRSLSKKWYENYSEKSTYIVYAPDNSYPDHEPKNLRCKVEEFVQREKIDIQTNCIGTPLLIKFSYHQNWKVIGAKKIYRITPSFMLIVPEQKNVTLYYGKRLYNYISYACGILGILLFFFYTTLEKIVTNSCKKLTKKYKKVSHTQSYARQKLKFSSIGEYIIDRSVPCLLIANLLIVIALIYTNKG